MTGEPGSTTPKLDRTLALVGLMGVGKTSVGRRLAQALGMPFRDADEEIEAAAGRSVSEIFSELGEQEFRAGERRVIARLLREEPHVLATGGGAFVNPDTRSLLKSSAVVVWLKADLEVLVRRTARRDTRPLLRNGDPRQVLSRLMEERHACYAEAHISVDTGDSSHQTAVEAVLQAIRNRAEAA